jgi:pantoate--beta-alanine ligase
VEVITTRAAWRAATDGARLAGRQIGFVPTMGALHPGHGSLIELARQRCGTVAVSIFVNPIQFGDAGDLERYPRPLSADLELLEAAGCDLVFTPEVTEIYPDFPEPIATSVTAGGVALGYEGAERPGHFDGMATVVALLFDLTGPSTAFFGEKDFQQLCVVRQMVEDLAMPVEVVGCPTVREADGLAMSSRNAQLSSRGRRSALVLHRALAAGAGALDEGEAAEAVTARMAELIGAEPGVELSYAAVVDPRTMTPPSEPLPGQELRLLVAAVVEGIRLIDNQAALHSRAR